MKHFIAILLFGVLFSCSSDVSNDEPASQTNSEESAEADVEVGETTDLEEDLRVYYRVEVPGPTVEDDCFPYPSAEFVTQMENGKVPNYGVEASSLYSYVVAHFDSITSRQYTPMEDEWDFGVYDWEQEFSDGIYYEEFFGGEGGPTATIHTSCSNFEAVYSTLNALVNHKYLDTDWEYDGSWNEERNHYAPDEGVGCFYHITLDDSTNYYKIENYCGC